MDFFWNVFEKSGNIEAYLCYKEAEKHRNFNTEKENCRDQYFDEGKISNF